MPQEAHRIGRRAAPVNEQALSIRAYADHRRRLGLPGGSKAAVEKAIAAGRITRTDTGKINADEADAAWAAHTTPRPGQEALGRAAPKRPIDISDYQKNRAEREYFMRLAAELEYAQEARQLVRVDEVKAEYFRLSRLARAALEAVPAQVAPRLVGITDQNEIQRQLLSAIRSALESLGDA